MLAYFRTTSSLADQLSWQLLGLAAAGSFAWGSSSLGVITLFTWLVDSYTYRYIHVYAIVRLLRQKISSPQNAVAEINL
jgi:hypothetical protein